MVKLLYGTELREALSAPNREELFIGAQYIPESELVMLYRPSLDALFVPSEWFLPKGSVREVPHESVRVTDYGQTIAFGDYEVAADAILYEFNPDFRRKARARLRQSNGIGGSIRRLRIQRGLRQEDFHPLSRREIGRIERGEIEKPQRQTLRHIAERLGVTVRDLADY